MSARVEAIRGAIVGKLAAVSGIGRVYGYLPYVDTEDQVRQVWASATTGKIRGAAVRRVGRRERRPALGGVRALNERWEIRLFAGFDATAGSETAFDGLIEAVCDAFVADESLGGSAAGTVLPDGTGGIQVEESNQVMLAGFLCHGARLILNTVSYA